MASGAAFVLALTTACTSSNLWQLEASLGSLLRNRLLQVQGPRAIQTAEYIRSHPNMRLLIGMQPELADRFPTRPVSSGASMSFSGHSPNDSPLFVLAHGMIHQDGFNESDAIADRARLDGLVAAMSASFVHEIVHARNRDALNLAVEDGFYAPIFAEDELTAWYAGTLFELNMLRQDPAYMRLPEAARLLGRVKNAKDVAAKDKLLDSPLLADFRFTSALAIAALARSNAEFERSIIKAHPNRPPMSDAAAIKAAADHYEDLARGAEELTRDRDLPGANPHLPTFRQSAALLRRQAAYFRDPGKLAQARAYYGRELAALRAEADWHREKSAALLAPFRYDWTDHDVLEAARKAAKASRPAASAN